MGWTVVVELSPPTASGGCYHTLGTRASLNRMAQYIRLLLLRIETLLQYMPDADAYRDISYSVDTT